MSASLEPETTPEAPLHPSLITNALAIFVNVMLTPLFLAAGMPRQQAFAAADQALACYPGPILQTGQAAAFAVTALDNLRIAAPDECPLTDKLKLQANATALSRNSARHAAAAAIAASGYTAPKSRTKPAAKSAQPEADDEILTEAEAREVIERVTSLIPNPGASNDPERERVIQWAVKMLHAAQAHLIEIRSLPPAEYAQQIRRVISLSLEARDLITGEVQLPPA